MKPSVQWTTAVTVHRVFTVSAGDIVCHLLCHFLLILYMSSWKFSSLLALQLTTSECFILQIASVLITITVIKCYLNDVWGREYDELIVVVAHRRFCAASVPLADKQYMVLSWCFPCSGIYRTEAYPLLWVLSSSISESGCSA